MRFRNLAAGLALLVTGTVVGVTSQQLASADVTSGDRPILVTIESCRLADTRPAFQVGPKSSPLGPGETDEIDTQQSGTDCTGKIPTSATALAINLTAPNATANGFITVWSDGPRPNGSTLNPAPGQLVFNAATVELANDNTFQIYNENGNTDFIIDVIGYYDNHNHDDRYYTESEVNSLLSNRLPADSTMIPIARFTIGVFDGVKAAEFRAPVTGVPSASYDGSQWIVDVPGEEVSINTQQALCAAVDVGVTVSINSSGGDLQIRVRNSAGTPVQALLNCVLYGDAP